MDRLIRVYKIARIHLLVWLCRRSRCIALHCGLTGIMAAEITEGPYRGWPLGAVLAMQNLRDA